MDWKFVDTDGGQKAIAFETEMQVAKAKTEIAAKTSLLLAGHHRQAFRRNDHSLAYNDLFQRLHGRKLVTLYLGSMHTQRLHADFEIQAAKN